MKKSLIALFIIISIINLKADDNAELQMKLALTADFQKRVAYLLMKEAFVVLAEATNTANHANRLNFANLIKNNVNGVIQNSYVIALVGRPNLVSETTTCSNDYCTTSATDAEIASQIATDWNLWAGQ